MSGSHKLVLLTLDWKVLYRDRHSSFMGPFIRYKETEVL
jgi:hypothetical protein